MIDSHNNNDDTDALLDVCNELKRSLSRLSYVGMGVTDDLDKELATLRRVIKKEGELEDIKSSIDKISQLLRTLDDDDQDVSQANERLDILAVLLDKKLPKSLKKELKTVQKKTVHEDASSIMNSIALVIQSYIAEVEKSQKKSAAANNGNNTDSGAQHSGNQKRGFFASLFGKKEQPVETQKTEQDSEQAKAKIAPQKVEVVDYSLPQKVKDSLQLLIDQLSRMDGYTEIANSLNYEITNIEKIEQLSNILEKITSAFIKISDQEHIQFEKFLKTLNNRIVRVNDFINQTLQFSQESNKDSKQLNLDLNSNLSDMKTSINNSANLDDAKNAVFSHMDSLISQINQYCIKQESSSEVLVAQMDKLSEQLRATEDEATRLKDDLAELRVRAQTDPLTNLPNRYSYNERLTQEYNRWRRYRHALTLVIGDIDLFKSVNDEHGHAFGDHVLKTIASFLSESIRESDFIARFGGEEFVLLLPETSIIDATRAMNKIRSGVSKLTVKNNGTMVPVTISFGISEFEKDDTAKAVFERADAALYRAKEKGRNLVCCQRAKSDE
jgi:diguanylate cyclase